MTMHMLIDISYVQKGRRSATVKRNILAGWILIYGLYNNL